MAAAGARSLAAVAVVAAAAAGWPAADPLPYPQSMYEEETGKTNFE